MMSMLKKRYHMEGKFTHTKRVILPSSRAKVNIYCHDAKDMVEALLTDPRWKDSDWLFFDDDPLAPPPDNLDYISDINTGEAYTKTYARLIKDPTKEMLVPIPMYIDGAVTGQFDKLEITTLQMTLGILNKRARDRRHAWRPIGYVSNYGKETSHGKKMLVDTGHIGAYSLREQLDEGEGEEDGSQDDIHDAQDYHTILATILESYRDLQEKGMKWDFCYKGKVYKDITLKFFIPFVKCDTDEADKLCGSYRSRSRGVSQLCRYCTCPTDESDKCSMYFPYKTEPKIKKLVQKNSLQKLKDLSQQPIDNAFYELCFGFHNDRGIHGACPMDMLHHILLGVFKYCRDMFFSQLGKTSAPAEEINSLAKLYGSLFAHQSDRDMPKTNFGNGIAKGKLMAKEFTGVLLIMAVILRSDLGREILASSRKGNFRHWWMIRDWTMLVETILQWEAFLKEDEMDIDIVKRLEKKHRFIMYLFKKVGKRTEGMGLKIVKFHAISHMAKDTLMFGVPNIVDTGCNESHHKETKVSAKTTQRDVREFEKQTALREDEYVLVDLAMQEINGRPLWDYFIGFEHPPEPLQDDDDAVKETDVATGGSRITVFRDEDNEVSWKFPMLREDNADDVKNVWDVDVLNFLIGVQDDLQNYTDELPIRCEHRRHGQIFRAHPNYRKRGTWNDWALVDWGPDGRLPCEIWCFIDLTDVIPQGQEVQCQGFKLQNNVYAVLESSLYMEDDPEDEAPKSELFRPIVKDVPAVDENGDPTGRNLYLGDVEAFLEPVAVVPNVGCPNKCMYFQVRSRKNWAEDFIDWVKEPHNMDNIEETEEYDGSDMEAK